MTFAPETLKQARAYLKAQDADLSDAELGIVGGPSHIAQGTSYHLGKDDLILSKNPYSVRTARDKAGLSNAASALDIDDDLDELRQLSIWMVDQCRQGAPDTYDIREIIFSPDGVNVYRWDRERGQTSQPIPDDDLSHRTHTHVSYYRDSEFRDKVSLFQRFYREAAMATINQEDWDNLRWRNYSTDVAGSDVALGGPAVGQKMWLTPFLKQMDKKLDVIMGMATMSPEALRDLVRQVVREELDKTRLGSE